PHTHTPPPNDLPTTSPTTPPSLHDALPISNSRRARRHSRSPRRVVLHECAHVVAHHGMVHRMSDLDFNLTETEENIRAFLHTFADRKSTRLNSSHVAISYAVFCLKKKRMNR